MNRMTLFSVMRVSVVVWFVLVCVGATAGCRPRVYLHKAMQTDLTGRSCRGYVAIKSCNGYCLTHEISDWQFPHKVSHHPVCSYGDRKPSSVKLEDCDPGVQPGTENYHFVEAVNCRCKICSSDDTSCEWAQPNSLLLGGLMLKKESQEDLLNDLE